MHRLQMPAKLLCLGTIFMAAGLHMTPITFYNVGELFYRAYGKATIVVIIKILLGAREYGPQIEIDSESTYLVALL